MDSKKKMKVVLIILVVVFGVWLCLVLADGFGYVGYQGQAHDVVLYPDEDGIKEVETKRLLVLEGIFKFSGSPTEERRVELLKGMRELGVGEDEILQVDEMMKAWVKKNIK